MENNEFKTKTSEEAGEELCRDDLGGVAGGQLEDVPTSAAEEESEMEKTTKDMGGLGGYGNRVKR